MLTALVAWYASAAGVANAMAERPVVEVGRPLWDLSSGLGRRGGARPRIGTSGGPSEAPLTRRLHPIHRAAAEGG